MNKDEEYFIIDTDCGSDDALAIMLAIHSIQSTKNVNRKLLGIVCCTGNTSVDKATRNVLLTLQIMNESNVKVYRGSHCSLLQKCVSCEYYGDDGLGNSVHKYDAIKSNVEEKNGVEAMISFVRKYPKKVTIVCLGPLTNLALAYLLDSDFFEFTKQLYILGGNINALGNVTPCAEFNFLFDPEAVHITLSKAVCPITIVPWELCDKHLTWDSYKTWTSIPTKKAHFFKQITQFVADNLRNSNAHGIEFSDFLVMAVYFNASCVLETKKWSASIELNGELTRGQLVVNKEKEVSSGLTFVTKIDYKAIEEMYEKMLS